MASGESNENIKLADEARDLFAKREYKQCIDCLDRLNNARATQANKLIARYSIDKDAKGYLDSLSKHSQEYANELTFGQQTIIDHNRALILAKQLCKYRESIELLERRIGLIESAGEQEIDRPILCRVYVLLVTIYMERKCRLKRALELLDRLSERLNGENLPKNFYYLKVRCYLANSDFINFRTHMAKLTNNEQFMVTCYLESFGGIEQSISKLSTFNSLNHIHLKNNEALTKFPNDKVLALYDLNKNFAGLTPEVRYNLGLMHLHTGNVASALAVFRSLLGEFRMNARLWSRIADCHLIQHKLSQPSPFRCSLESLTRFVGENQHKKLLLKPTVIKVSDEENLRSARSCLLNAYILAKQPDPSFYPSNEPIGNELRKFKASLLAKLAYVNLCLCDYVSANFYADLNLKEDCPKNLLFIETVLYKFEALIWLNRADEAEQLIKRLESQLTKENVSEEYEDYLGQCKRLNYVDWDKRWLKYIVLQNLASCVALQQKLPDLKKYLHDANVEVKSIQESQMHLILLSVYMYVASNSG